MTNPRRALDYTTPEGQAINDLYKRIIASTNGGNDWGSDELGWLSELGFAEDADETTIVPNPTLTQYRRNSLIVLLQDSGLTERDAEAVVSEYTTRVLTDDRARSLPLAAGDTSTSARYGGTARSKDGHATGQETQR